MINILLGIISKEDDHFITFKTANRSYTINKSLILSIVDTEEIFNDSENYSRRNEKIQQSRGIKK